MSYRRKILFWGGLIIVVLVIFIGFRSFDNLLKQDKAFKIYSKYFKDKYLYTNAFYFLEPNNLNNELKLIYLRYDSILYRNVFKEVRAGKAVIWYVYPIFQSFQDRINQRKLKFIFSRFSNFYITDRGFLIYSGKIPEISPSTFLVEFLYDSLKLGYRAVPVYSNEGDYLRIVRNPKFLPDTVKLFYELYDSIKNEIYVLAYFDYPYLQSFTNLKKHLRRIAKDGLEFIEVADGIAVYPKELTLEVDQIVEQFKDKYVFTNSVKLFLDKVKKVYFLNPKIYPRLISMVNSGKGVVVFDKYSIYKKVSLDEVLRLQDSLDVKVDSSFKQFIVIYKNMEK